MFDVLSVGRRRNLPASRLTTEPNFSPSDSKEVSSWQRLEQGTVDEIDCGKNHVRRSDTFFTTGGTGER